jgi:predicted AlkP superfamily phosphohydrolase/phosphomutase
MWANLSTFERVLDDATVTAMAKGAATLAAACVGFLLLAWIRRSGVVHRLVLAAALLLLAGASVVIPLAARGPGSLAPLEARSIDTPAEFTPAESASHVQVIAIDAGSLDFIASATAEGRLPNFGRILDAGAVMHLATIHPTSAEAVWAAAMTGKLPLKNGVRSAGIYRFAGGDVVELLPNYCFAYELVRFGFLTQEPHTSATLRTRALWSMLSTHGLSVGAVAWPLTAPAPTVRGYLVSDTYLQLAQTPSGIVDSAGVYPQDAQPDVTRAVEVANVDADAIAAAPGGPSGPRDEAPGRVDRIYGEIALELAARRPPEVSLTRYQRLDPVGHYFLRYATPSAFGDVPDDEHRALASVLDRHYRAIDEVVGRAIKALGPDDLLLVVSGFGMEPMGLWKRVVERLIGDADLNGTHDAAPDGFLMAYGSAVARGRLMNRASIVDVAPTVLYFLGLPVGRDMDGYARTDMFQRTFTDERPITFIPTYDK